MNIHVTWENEEHTLLRYVYNACWTTHEFHESLKLGYQMQNAVKHPVSVIIDMSKCDMYAPKGIISYFEVVVKSLHPNTHHVYVVTRNLLMLNMFHAFSKIYPKYGETIRVASTFEEAAARLYFERQTPPNLLS